MLKTLPSLIIAHQGCLSEEHELRCQCWGEEREIIGSALTELTSHILRVLSSEAETRRLESDDQATSEIP